MFSHLSTLTASLSISTASKPSQPLLYGSQLYFTEPKISYDVLKSEESPGLLVSQLQCVITHCKDISQDNLVDTLHKIYFAMLEVVQKGSLSDLAAPSSFNFDKWIYLKGAKQFVSPNILAVEHNPSLRQNLEPYLYTLPDSLSFFVELFSKFGMNKTISQEQILSVLRAMREDIEGNAMLISVSASWDIIMAILNWLTENGTKTVNCGEQMLVPVESKSDWPDLIPAGDVTYTDNKFLKQFTISSETDKTLHFVNERININMAKCLKLTPLSEELDISGDTFEDAGQHEPLTVRLRNILRDYKDGLTIIKELIQNADDAEATEINICYDARTHCLDLSRLFFPGMSKSHGPALIVHNDKTFTEEDFENITKLAGATKMDKHLKIRKFGVGFCSVYHITDIPSFVSQDRLYIFDPTLKHLGNEIKNPALPGKRLKYMSRIIQNSKQLEPYIDLFGFNCHEVYEGTMFRLPFCIVASELSGTCYCESSVMDLLESIYESSEKLVLFLQHVKTISFYHINSGQTQPEKLFSVDKKEFSLSAASLEHTLFFSVDSQKGDASKKSKWLISSQISSNNSKYAVCSVAALLDNGVCCIQDDLRGEVFCFLPLSQTTGLPVHISCNFAVINNRRGIWTSDEPNSSGDIKEVKWNKYLMESVIPVAYSTLLCSLKSLFMDNKLPNYKFHDLWPLGTALKQVNPWEIFIEELYKRLADSSLFYSESKKEWLTMTQSRFLGTGIFKEIETLPCVSQILHHLNFPLVNLPVRYMSLLELSDFLINEEKFTDIFFSNLDCLDDICSSRNAVILCILEQYATEQDANSQRSKLFHKHLTNCACIPCSPDGSKLKVSNNLINPKAPFANLYDVEEGMFPMEELTRELPILALKRISIITDRIPWSYIVERAQTITGLMDSDTLKACRRIQLIIQAITSYTDYESDDIITSIQFLPVLKNPNTYPSGFQWDGEGKTLCCGKELMHPSDGKNASIAGSQVTFVCENQPEEGGCGPISKKAEEVLGLRKVPSFSDVTSHFMHIIQHIEQENLPSKWTSDSCCMIYHFMEESLKEKDFTDSCNGDLEKLKNLPCILVADNKFVHVTSVSHEWPLTSGPYLYHLPPSLTNKTALCTGLGIKLEFSAVDIKTALDRMKEDFEDESIDIPCMDVVHNLIPLLHKKGDEFKEVTLMLSDENNVLRLSQEMAYNDAPWCPRDGTHIYVNDEILPRELARKLGVKPVRSKLLEKYSSKYGFKKLRGSEFGQHEDLTRRIHNIIHDYPFDITVLKELLQNADDAKAKKMYIILDKRTHRKESVLSEEWQDLQGPALLIWNDSIFSEEDLEGIQELGLGSKRSEAETIGQYGIGFNVVYHLTDCPSFVTNNEILCIMDPHCRYVPGAEELSPGRRFDGLNEGFWDEFPDMRSAYLRDSLSDLLSEVISGGSLFHFPIRHTQHMLSLSDIIDKTDDSVKPLTADELSHKISTWMSQMKKAMFFLNSVSELKFLEIEERATEMPEMSVRFHLKSEIDTSAQPDRVLLQDSLSSFNRVTSSKTCVIMYPLTLIEVGQGGNKDVMEKWLIQQGVGDIDNEGQTWKFVKTVKPRHGLAAPLVVSNNKDDASSGGQVFCFLPLPVKSGLPVHVNGHFILNSSRRELWTCTDASSHDDKSSWNTNLVRALASSYADFLHRARNFYLNSDYKALLTAVNAVKQYYNLFPDFALVRSSDSRGCLWQLLAQEVYKSVIAHNYPVLCAVHLSKAKTYTPKWCPPKATFDADNVYFWSFIDKEIYPILEALGMQISAESFVMRRFNDTRQAGGYAYKLKPFRSVTGESVFEYYTKFSAFSTNSGNLPIKNTPFKSVQGFLTFTNFILMKEAVSTGNPLHHIFPDRPFGHYLLLTADGILRKFNEAEKILSSAFSAFFPGSLDCFLHPDLLSVEYTGSYFIQPSDSNRTTKFILKILQDNLPPKLRSLSVISGAEKVVSRDKLKDYWTCFVQDSVFSGHISDILQQWALLLSSDNRLYSTRNNILPVCESKDYRQVLGVLNKLKMPFLDAVVVARTNCPKLSQRAHILANIYYSNIEISILSLLENRDIDVIIDYLRNEIKLNDKEILKQLKSLPLFENIDGTYASLLHKRAYLWPEEALSEAYQKWKKGYDAVFIKSTGKWSALGTPEQLSIDTISAEDLYVDFVFPNFYKMNEGERYRHLEFIRDTLYHTNKNFKGLSLCEHVSINKKIHRAVKFISALKDLHCIGRDQPLHCISVYCDHTVEIFKAFSGHFLFLPEEYRNNQWLSFMRDLDIQQHVSQQEYLQFCHETADGKVRNIEECSDVLLEYLFSYEVRKKWCHESQFLQRVSNVAFLSPQTVPKLSWLVPCVFPARQMVKMNGSALLSQAPLLWTEKPIIEVPDSSCIDLMNGLGIVHQSRVSGVITNTRNICEKSKYANENLFANYPKHLVSSSECESLLGIMLSNLSYLDSHTDSITCSDLSTLKCLPCIPVHNTTAVEEQDDHNLVLIKPCCVVCEDVKSYHLFLHKLPSKLESLRFGILENIGVKHTLELSHMQVVLEAAFKATEGSQMDMNTSTCIQLTIQRLERFLRELSNEEDALKLEPLYLPDVSDRLIPSKSLLYGDTPNFWGKKLLLTLDNLQYSHLNFDENSDYKCNSLDICRKLPLSVRPIRLSEVCEIKVHDSGGRVVDSEVIIQLKKILELLEIPEAIVAFINKVLDKQENSNDLEKLIGTFLSNIHIKAISNLHAQIVLKENNTPVGRCEASFWFVPGESESLLYINSNLKPDDKADITCELGDILCEKLSKSVADSKFCNNDVHIGNMIKSCLAATSVDHIQKILEKVGASIKDKVRRQEKKLGAAIQKCWEYRLAQDIDNIFNPMEYVGYESDDGVIIIAQIAYPILQGEGESEFMKKYRIYVGENDAEGIDVSVLSLYKFLVGNKRPKEPQSPNAGHEIVPFSDNDQANKLRSSLIVETLIDAKKKLCQQLREIWRLDADLRRKAIKRLILRWHPDKNLDNPEDAEEIFKFLQKQIEHLEKGEPLDDIEVIRTSTDGYRHSYNYRRKRHYHWHSSSHYYQDYHYHWSYTAHQHYRSSHNEFSEGSDTDCDSDRGGGGGGRGEGGRKYSTSDYFPFSEGGSKDPQEGWCWVKQAETDYKFITDADLQAESNKSCAQVCFMAHQVVEKALKGAVYALCGLDGRSLTDHSLTRHAYALQTVKPDHTHGLAEHCVPLEDYYLKTRYPNRWPGYIDIPSDHYTQGQANEARSHAKAVLAVVKTIMVA